jgi:hypothetical protein
MSTLAKYQKASGRVIQSTGCRLQLVNIDIMTNKALYKPSDLVEGEVRISSNEEFEFNAIHLTFLGREHTRIVVSHGKTSSVHTDERIYFSQKVDLATEGTMTVEGFNFPFSFTIPADVPSSYRGDNGWIEYTLKAIIERSWAIDPKSELELSVRASENRPLSQIQQATIEDKGVPIFIAEADNDTIALGDAIELRFRAEQELKIRGVRIELIAEEEAHAKRYDRNSRTTLVREFVEAGEIQYGLWKDIRLETSDGMPYSFKREILSNKIFIKLTLDIPWAPDKSAIIPVRMGHYSDGNDTRPSDIFDYEWHS